MTIRPKNNDNIRKLHEGYLSCVRIKQQEMQQADATSTILFLFSKLRFLAMIISTRGFFLIKLILNNLINKGMCLLEKPSFRNWIQISKKYLLLYWFTRRCIKGLVRKIFEFFLHLTKKWPENEIKQWKWNWALNGNIIELTARAGFLGDFLYLGFRSY